MGGAPRGRCWDGRGSPALGVRATAKVGEAVRTVLITAIITAVLGGACVAVLLVGWDRSKIEGSGTVVTEDRAVSGITGLRSEGGDYRIVVTTGTEESLAITADDNIVEELTTEVDDGILEIHWGDRGDLASLLIFPTDPVLIELTVTQLSQIESAGSGEIVVDGISGDALAVEIEGSGGVTLSNLAVATLSADIEGSGDLAADGRADDLQLEIAGSGRILAQNLSARTGTVDVDGSGDIELQVADTLDVQIDGSGNVDYLGDPAITESISGSGRIRPVSGASSASDEATPAATPRSATPIAATPRLTITGTTGGPGTPRAARPSATPTPDAD